MKTARKMGIATVAVYSEADRDSPARAHGRRSRAYRPATRLSESYLVMDRIVEACRQTGAMPCIRATASCRRTRVREGARMRAGIVFIGPREHAITSMGDKITSKKLAAEAGVSTDPRAITGIIEGPDHAVEIAREIGYPVMLKASAGGGGKGMRVVYNDEECRDGFDPGH